MVDLVPELKLDHRRTAAGPELPPLQAQSRFQLVFRRFLGVFARPDHPLVLFLDDLQWLDPATLDLHRASADPARGAAPAADRRLPGQRGRCRHPLTRKLEAIRQAGARVQEIGLAPLSCADVRQSDRGCAALAPAEAAPLAQLVHGKTGGNPFFAIQFLNALADEGLLAFDHGAARWRWDLDRIHAKGYTDNVVDLMVGKLTRLPAATQAALQQLACVGNLAEVATLCLIRGISEQAVHAELWEAVRQELILPRGGRLPVHP